MFTVYRCYSSTEVLLYVGYTKSWTERLNQHAVSSPWFPEVATMRLVHYTSRQSALLAEWEGISCENPVHNVRRTPHGIIHQGLTAKQRLTRIDADAELEEMMKRP